MRTNARETLFKILFSEQFQGDYEELKQTLYATEKLSDDDIAYCDKILNVINENLRRFIFTLDEYSVAFPEKRIFPADKAILLIGIAEIFYCPEIPSKVIMSEAANIAAKYSSAKSPTYVSGILSAIANRRDGGDV